MRTSRPGLCFLLAAVLTAPSALPVSVAAQDRLKEMPGYAHYRQMSPRLTGAIRSGALAVEWSADGSTFTYWLDGKRFRYDVAGKTATEIGPAGPPPGPAARRLGGAGDPERGRQFASADSPDKKLRARFNPADLNLYLIDQASGKETAITSDGSRDRRIKYGTASWVYGEELEQTTAMWWSPDSRKLAFYRFDESRVPDYYLQLDQTELQSAIDAEAYPKAGAPNPLVDLRIYDVATGKTVAVDVRDGKPFTDEVVGHYAYRIVWSPDGRELLFNRTNRRQNVLELAAANPDSGAVRVVLREEWPASWVENLPTMLFLEDGRRFIWESERSGWKNFYLYDLSGRLIVPLTRHRSAETGSIIKVDERAGVLFYMARDGDNHLKLQLHRVGLDGTGDVRLTDPAWHHTVGACDAPAAREPRGGGASCAISPDNRYVVDVYQRHDTPPATRLLDAAAGTVVAEIAASDTRGYDALKIPKPELFTFPSADGKTTLHGIIQFPSAFDPARKYPVLVPVYAGPGSASRTARETFAAPNPLAEYGFLIVTLDSRAAPGRGKPTLDEVYMKLGQVEVDDMAAGVKALARRPYVDAARVGIYGTSYGGYASLMALLRHSDLFAAASASSPVTGWEHYDTVYTERYMRTPQDNKAGYDAGRVMAYVKQLKGRLMLYYGTADNNVHPSNTMQLIAALQDAGKSFDLQVGPDRGHSGINQDRMMEFFVEHLLMRPAAHATF